MEGAGEEGEDGEKADKFDPQLPQSPSCADLKDGSQGTMPFAKSDWCSAIKDVEAVNEMSNIVSPNELMKKLNIKPESSPISSSGSPSGRVSLPPISPKSSVSVIELSEDSAEASWIKPRAGSPNKFRALGKAAGIASMASKINTESEAVSGAFVVNSMKQEKLVFDKRVFNRDQRAHGGLTPRARTVLGKRSYARTDEDLAYLMEVVERLLCFRKYSRKIKHELAKVISYDTFENGRRIIKEGQPGRSLYFIVSGRAVVLTEGIDKKTGDKKQQVVAELYEGSCFGELALLHNVKRSASIVCKGKSEFLRVDKEDFEAVLRQCHEDEWKERMVAIASIPQFQNWTQSMIKQVNKASKLKEYIGNTMVYGDCCLPAPDELFFVVKGDCHIVRAINLFCRTSMFGKKNYYVGDHPVVQDAIRTARLNGRRKAMPKNEVWSVERRYWSIGAITKGFYFSVGENFKNTYIVTKSRCEFLLVPRVHFVKAGHSRTLDTMRDELNRALPDDRVLLRKFWKETAWERYKQECVDSVVSRSHIPRTTSFQDVPRTIRQENGMA